MEGELMYVWWFVAGVVAGALGLFALIYWLGTKTERQITPRRRELFRMIRSDLDEARAAAKMFGNDALVARVELLRNAEMALVVGSDALANAFAAQIDTVFRIVDGNDGAAALMKQYLVRAEFNARTVALTFVYARDEAGEAR